MGMPERIRQQRKTEEQAPREDTGDTAASDMTSRLRDDLDSLLDEIDGVLEENAEEFVRNYVQKGGQ